MHRLTEFSLKRPWLTLAILLAITAVLGVGVPKVKQAYGFRVLIGADHPAIQALDSMIEQFSGGYPIRIAWQCGDNHPCENIFDENSLQMVNDLTQEFAALPLVINTLSPSNASVFVPTNGGFLVRRFVENGVIAEDVRALQDRVLDDPLWVGNLVSPDGKLGVLFVQPADNAPETDLYLYDRIQAATAEFSSQGFEFHVLGSGPETISSGRVLAQSMSALIPVMAIVIVALLYFLTRSWQQTLMTLLTMGFALLWTRGVLGWLGWPQDAVLQVLAPLVVIVGVCDAVHLLSRYAAERIAHLNQGTHDALLKAARDAGPACIITTFTTAVALASFTTSDLDTFVRFGVILPIGVVACLILSFSLLPIGISLLPSDSPKARSNKAMWTAVTHAMIETGSKRTLSLLITSALLVAFFGYGWVVHLRADNNFLEAFGEKSEVFQSVTLVEDSLGSSQTLEVDIQLPPGVEIEQPSTLEALAQFSSGVSQIERLDEAESVINLISRLNRLLNADNPDFEKPGDSAKANAELLEIIAFDDPSNLGRWLSTDRKRLRVSMNTVATSQKEKETLLEQVRSHVQKTLPSDWGVQLTGVNAIQYDWVRDIQATQLRSFPIAFGIVFILVSVFLRSWKLGLAAMVPTLLPVVVVLGAMGWIGMSLDVARAMLAAVVIGIGVDDAIHLLAHYKVRRDAGDDPHAAIAAALQHTGRAIVTTSVALALGFLTLMMSAWQTVASFGLFVAIAIIGALVATLFVLPALIFAFSPKEKAVASLAGTSSGPRVLTPAPALESKD